VKAPITQRSPRVTGADARTIGRMRDTSRTVKVMAIANANSMESCPRRSSSESVTAAIGRRRIAGSGPKYS